MNTVKTLLLAGCTLALGLTACNTTEKGIVTTASLSDISFMKQAAQGNLAEIEAGALASNQGMAIAIREFGSQMVADHKMAQAKLKAVGDQVFYYDLPTEPDSAHKMMAMQLSAMSGRMFDSTYIYGQVKDHKMTVDLLNTIMQKSNSMPLKMYAEGALPTVQMHYSHADSLARTMFP